MNIFAPLVLAIAGLASVLPALADMAPGPRIVVTGEGENAVPPDVALLSLGVMNQAGTAREALDATNAGMSRVIAALKAQGVAPRDLQTGGLQIAPTYTYTNNPDGTQKSDLTGYQVTNTLSVRVRDLGKTGEIIDRAVALGVNQGSGITFTNDDPASAVAEARKRAVADAIQKAKTLSQAAGVELGRVLEITDQNVAVSPMPISAKTFDRAASAPIEAGENSYRVQVTVTFELL